MFAHAGLELVIFLLLPSKQVGMFHHNLVGVRILTYEFAGATSIQTP
jgi:hypothetical protein